MALTPEDILNKQFQSTQFRKGYDEREVDDFLDEIVAEMRALMAQRDDYLQQLNDCRAGRGLPSAVAGPVVSADTWTQAHSRLDILHDRHGSLCEEMEAAAVGRIAGMHGIPTLFVKDISNNEYLRESDLQEFSDFPVAEVGKRAAALLAQTIALL